MANNYTQFSQDVPCRTEEEFTWLLAALAEGVDPYGSCCQFERQDNGVWLYAEEGFDLDGLIEVLEDYTRKFKGLPPIAITWASWCDKPRVGEFTGGAVVVFNGGSVYMDAYQWSQGAVDRYNKQRTTVDDYRSVGEEEKSEE